jgi:hypothetical protein
VTLGFQWSNNLTFPSLNTVPIGATNSTTDGITVAISAFDVATDNITITVPAAKAAGGKLFGRLQAATP